MAYLCPDVSQEVFDVFPDEEVVHDGLAILLQDLLELVDVVVLEKNGDSIEQTKSKAYGT